MLTFVQYIAISMASDTNMFQGQDPQAANLPILCITSCNFPGRDFIVKLKSGMLKMGNVPMKNLT
jgi:hypothetical protein